MRDIAAEVTVASLLRMLPTEQTVVEDAVENTFKNTDRFWKI